MRTRVTGWIAVGMLVASVGGIVISGCGKKPDDAAVKPTTPGDQPASLVVQPKTGATPGGTATQMAFKDAVLFEPPDGEQRPPDRTMAGKNVAALFEQIAGQEGAPGLWDKVALTNGDGTPLRYLAQLTTDLGVIEMELYPHAAPNHVRNFIALAQAGYYNGLPFHRSLHGQVDGQTVAYLEGGCPLGTGEFGFGSIGYWLKPEITGTLTHEEGTVGAVHGANPESAACKFYISLTRSPGMDGSYTIFGKITKGLDIAHTINKRPVAEDDETNDRPKEPVIIRSVTIHSGGANAAIVARNQ